GPGSRSSTWGCAACSTKIRWAKCSTTKPLGGVSRRAWNPSSPLPGVFSGRAWSPQRPWRTDVFAKDELRVAVLCLDSAWCAQDDQDRGHLLLGRSQWEDALFQARGADLRLALLHHPWDWLKDFKAAREALTGSG